MTKPSRRWFLVVAVASLATLVVAGWLCWPVTAITRANAERVHTGMTQEEIEAILGGPPRDDSTGPLGPDNSDYTDVFFIWPPLQAPGQPPRLEWVSDVVAVRVSLDPAGRAATVSRVPLYRRNESPGARLRRWLGW